jgi:hypothetical protein
MLIVLILKLVELQVFRVTFKEFFLKKNLFAQQYCTLNVFEEGRNAANASNIVF